MQVDIERQGNYVAANVEFADFSTKGKGKNWQAALLDALARVEVEMMMRLFHAGILLPEEKKHQVESPDEPIAQTLEDRQAERWFGLELINGQEIGKNVEVKAEEGMRSCAVCAVPTWGTLCACCTEFAAVDWKKQRVSFRPKVKDAWTKIDV